MADAIECDTHGNNLLSAVVALAEILDNPIDKNGMISVQYQFASEIIHSAQLAAKSTVEDLECMADAIESYLVHDKNCPDK